MISFFFPSYIGSPIGIRGFLERCPLTTKHFSLGNVFDPPDPVSSLTSLGRCSTLRLPRLLSRHPIAACDLPLPNSLNSVLVSPPPLPSAEKRRPNPCIRSSSPSRAPLFHLAPRVNRFTFHRPCTNDPSFLPFRYSSPRRNIHLHFPFFLGWLTTDPLRHARWLFPRTQPFLLGEPI